MTRVRRLPVSPPQTEQELYSEMLAALRLPELRTPGGAGQPQDKAAAPLPEEQQRESQMKAQQQVPPEVSAGAAAVVRSGGESAAAARGASGNPTFVSLLLS